MSEPAVSQPEEPDAFAEALLALKDEDGVFRSSAHTLSPGSSLFETLREAGLDPAATRASVEALETIKDPRRLPAGLHFTVGWGDESFDRPVKISFQFDPVEWVEMTSTSSEGWQARLIKVPVTIVPRTFVGVVNVSLWDSAVAAGMDPELISELASVFAWQIDFNREVRSQDRWRIVVDQKIAGTRHVSWGAIRAAEYINAGESYSAVLFPQKGDDGSYYMPDGNSLKRLFLKSPIRLARVSSRFKKNRFHPILKRTIAHNGVDYAARPGTPVMSVGKGTVERAGSNGTSGIMVKVKHNSTYETAYLHLSGIAKGIRKGTSVKQGQVIGYVGSTGLATGPHLHFSFYEKGRFVDPMGRKFPSEDPIPKDRMTAFTQVVATVMPTLPNWPRDVAQRKGPKVSRKVANGR
jgi:murein DD-endopeptidase MepM/ murein hydrolase activator NlpD